MSTSQATKTTSVVSREIRKKIEEVLRDIKAAHRSLSHWTCRQKAALLAGIKAGIALAFDIVDDLHITGKTRADWGTKPAIRKEFDHFFAAA